MEQEWTTERLVLRPWRSDDAAALYAVASDGRVGPAADWPAHRSVDESREVIRTVFAAPETYAVVLRETARPVGCIGLLFAERSRLDLADSEAEAGYWIGVPWWGCGMIPEALRALQRRAFAVLGLTALRAVCFVGNEASRRVLVKCGFRHLGDGSMESLQGVRSVSFYCQTCDEWRSVSLRQAGTADIPLIRALAGEAFPATYRELLSPAQIDYMMAWMYSSESLHEQLRAGHVWFVATLEGEPCGYLSVERVEPDRFLLQKLYVLPRFQGRGVGRALFGRALEHVRSRTSEPCRLELHVNRGNRALHFYERMGMRRLCAGDFPIGGGYCMNDYIMGLDIE